LLSPWSEWSYTSENEIDCKKYFARKKECMYAVSEKKCYNCRCGTVYCHEEMENKEEELENCGVTEPPVPPIEVLITTTTAAPKWEGASWKGHK